MPPRELQPASLLLRTYQVGFGDCFLLTFQYPDEARHLLIDFGSTAFPKGRTGKPPLVRIAEDIRAECGGKLHAVVVTHRHKDHLAGFETRKDGKGPGDIIRSLEPELVVQPWTEDPALEPDATKPQRASTTPGRAFVSALTDMHQVAESVLSEARRMRTGVPKNVLQQLQFLGEDNLKNASAVKNLMTMGKRRVYAHYGSEVGLEKVLPGVRVKVLGPPTLEQSGKIRSARATDEAEYWHLQAHAAPTAARRTRPLFKGAVQLTGRAAPPAARWFIPRVRNLRAESLLELVRVLDNTLNNTSLILLLDVCGQKLLFPGDAQLENWLYALEEAEDHQENLKLLEDVRLYKVGHHGSLNATPKTVWNRFKKKGPARTTDRLTSVVSTMSGKHGRDERGTEVPRSSLVKELQKHSHYVTTQNIRGRKLREDLRIVFSDAPGAGSRSG